MEQIETIKKKYAKRDVSMLRQAHLMYNAFITNKTIFITIFPSFNDPFAANWRTATVIAEDFLENKDVINNIKLLTEAVKEQMLAARNHYQALILYLRLAYPASAGVVEKFGQNKYKTSRKHVLKMIELMDVAYLQANQPPYQQQLISKGFTQADIDMLKTIEQGLRAKNNAQETAKNDRKMATQTRYAALNAVWDFMVQVNAAAQLIFTDSRARYKPFRLYPEIKYKPKVKVKE